MKKSIILFLISILSTTALTAQVATIPCAGTTTLNPVSGTLVVKTSVSGRTILVDTVNGTYYIGAGNRKDLSLASNYSRISFGKLGTMLLENNDGTVRNAISLNDPSLSLSNTDGTNNTIIQQNPDEIKYYSSDGAGTISTIDQIPGQITNTTNDGSGGTSTITQIGTDIDFTAANSSTNYSGELTVDQNGVFLTASNPTVSATSVMYPSGLIVQSPAVNASFTGVSYNQNAYNLLAPTNYSTTVYPKGKNDLLYAPKITYGSGLTLTGTAPNQTLTASGGGGSVTPTSTTTLTNKRITKRVLNISSSTFPAINTDNFDKVVINAQTTGITSMTSSLTGSPNNGDQLEINIIDNGTSQSIFWGASFVGKNNVVLPVLTKVGFTTSVKFEWDTSITKWVDRSVDIFYNSSPLIQGNIVVNDFNSSDWTVTGSGTTFNGTNCTLTNGNDDFSSNYAVYNKYYNDLEDATFVATIKIGTANSNGVGIGFSAAANVTIQNLICQLNTDATYGARLWVNNSFISNGSPSIGTISVGDNIQITAKYSNRLATITGKNLTTGGATQTYTYQTAYAYPFTPNTWQSSMRFTIWNVGSVSTNTITSFSVSTNQPKNIQTLFVGDSKTAGSGASTYSTTIWYQGNSNIIKAVNAGPGDVTQDVVNRLNEIKAYNSQNVILWIGCNDIRFGTPTATWQSNYATIVNTLKAAGINVYHLLSSPENTQDVTALNYYIASNYTNVIDIYTPLWSGTGTGLNASYNCGDGVHLNDAGYAVVYNTISSYYPNIISQSIGSLIPNNAFQNSTISGVGLGNNLYNHTPGYGLAGNVYNGSAITPWVTDTTVLVSKQYVTAKLAGKAASTTKITSTQVTASGTGAATTISIAHGLGVTPTYFNAIATNSAASNISYVTADATNINIVYTVAPLTGTNNLSYNLAFRP